MQIQYSVRISTWTLTEWQRTRDLGQPLMLESGELGSKRYVVQQ